MSEELEDQGTDINEIPEVSKKYRKARRAAQPDELLGIFTDMAEQSGLSVGLTLTVGGAIVTGDLVGRREWLRRLIEAAEPLQFLSGVAKSWDETAAGIDADDPEEPYERMIHLANAHYIMGATSGGTMFWRGRLSQVDGWNFGSMS